MPDTTDNHTSDHRRIGALRWFALATVAAAAAAAAVAVPRHRRGSRH